jgi:hypothetical protein
MRWRREASRTGRTRDLGGTTWCRGHATLVLAGPVLLLLLLLLLLRPPVLPPLLEAVVLTMAMVLARVRNVHMQLPLQLGQPRQHRQPQQHHHQSQHQPRRRWRRQRRQGRRLHQLLSQRLLLLLQPQPPGLLQLLHLNPRPRRGSTRRASVPGCRASLSGSSSLASTRTPTARTPRCLATP